MNTWDKKVKVNNKYVPKRKVLDYYKNLWNSSTRFRNLLKKNGAFIRASYNGKPVVKRKKIKIKDFDDLKRAIKEHAVEFHVPSKKTPYTSYLDIDLPPRYKKRRKQVSRSVIDQLKDEGVNVSLVTDAPSGAHIFSTSPQSKLKKALQNIKNKNKRTKKRYHIGKSSRNKIVLDPSEPNVAIPDSLSMKGKPYKQWKK